MGVAGLGDRTQAAALARTVLRWYEPDERGQVIGSREAVEVADFDDEDQCREGADPTERRKPGDRAGERVGAGDQGQLGVEQGDLGKTGVEIGPVVGEGPARSGLLEGLGVEPGAVAGTQDVLPQVAPGPEEVAHCLLVGRQSPGPRSARRPGTGARA